MKSFIGIVQHEFRMSIRRKSLWIGNALVISLFVMAIITGEEGGSRKVFSEGSTPWQEAGDMVYLFNMLIPLIAGILSSDRLQRDFRNGMRELQKSSAVTDNLYLAGKYTGVLLSTFVPFLIAIFGLGIYAVTSGFPAMELFTGLLAGFAVIAIPSFAFVVAFSLACPLVIPVRVYQILFTGYWFWGNFLNDRVFPTVSGTILNSSGIYAMQGFFAGTMSRSGEPLHTPLEAWLNITVLLACAAMALAGARYYMAKKAEPIR
jgi:MFS family permease